jgi:hypothetical protein
MLLLRTAQNTDVYGDSGKKDTIKFGEIVEGLLWGVQKHRIEQWFAANSNEKCNVSSSSC